MKEIFDQDPTQLLQDASPHLHELAVFVLKYGQCAANRDQLLKNVIMKDQKDAFYVRILRQKRRMSFDVLLTISPRLIWGGRHGSSRTPIMTGQRRWVQ
jgi:hypothetical protein